LQTFRDKLEGSWTQNWHEDLATPEAFEQTSELVWEFFAARRMNNVEGLFYAGQISLATILCEG